MTGDPLPLGVGLAVHTTRGPPGVQPPAPPAKALLGTQVGEQVAPTAKRPPQGEPLTLHPLRGDRAEHVPVSLPARRAGRSNAWEPPS